MRTILSITTAVFVFTNAARADIYQWEYVSPADPNQGRQQAAMLCPDGAGVDATPSAVLAHLNLTMAYLSGADLAHASLRDANLTNADLSDANLAGAYFSRATMSGASLSGAKLQAADLSFTTSLGFTAAQLYSTGSYRAREMAGVRLYWNDLRGWNFAGQNLAGAVFGVYPLGADAFERPAALLAGADFTGANLRGANFQAVDLHDVKLTAANIQGASFARFEGACFFTPECSLAGGLTLSQLYSTSSYQAKDLSDIDFFGNNLAAVNFASQNLTNSDFTSAMLTDADFTGALILGARFDRYNATGTGISPAQLYSTASFHANGLSGFSVQMNNLVGVNLVGKNLVNSNFGGATLTRASFSQSNLTYANFGSAMLADADFTGAEVRRARFDRYYVYDPSTQNSVVGTGITPAQLYTTASYQAHDLSGVGLSDNNLAGANFSGQNLTSADLDNATLVNADFRWSTLKGTNFGRATLTGADFTDADLRGAIFYREYIPDTRTYIGEITLAQLYSTASYQAQDLSNIQFAGNFTGGAFAGQNFTNSRFELTTLAGADFTAADLRGATGVLLGAISTNLIRPDGHIEGLSLHGGELLVVRDYDGSPFPFQTLIPIRVVQQFSVTELGSLRMIFEADEWNSTISFANGIPVALGGTLELTFADDVNLASQVGRTFNLFDWTDVTPTGIFAVSSPYMWDLSNLYITGEVTLTAVAEPTTFATAMMLLALLACCPHSRQ